MTTRRQTIPPYPLVKTLSRFREFLWKLRMKTFPGPMVLYEQFQNLWLLPALYVAAELNLAELLRDGPLSPVQLAGKSGADPDSLARVLRALASQGIFRQHKDGRYSLNAQSKALLDDESSLRYMLMQHLGPVNWQALGDLLYSVRTGRAAFAHVHGKEMYDLLKDNPAQFELFDRSMSNLSELAMAPLLQAYSFRPFHRIADIGGGEGAFLAGILEKYPLAEGILFDLPEALSKAGQTNAGNKIRVFPGNFLESIPVSADLYILKNILHNWNDEQCTLILNNIRKSMPQGAVIAVIEMIVPVDDRPSISKLLDIQMMVSFPEGRERTLEEYRKLAQDAGLRVRKVVPTVAPVSVMEMVSQ